MLKLFSPKIIICVLTLLMCACHNDQQQQQTPPPTPVQVAKPDRHRIQQTIPVSGTVVSPFAPTRCSFLLAGKVVQVALREGEVAKQGQVLATLDTTEYAAGFTAAKAQLEQAKIAANQAADELKRMRFLYERQSLARNDYEKYLAAAKAAEQKVVQAKANVTVNRKHLADTTLLSPTSGYIAKRYIEPGQTVAAGMTAFEIVKLDPVEILIGVPETDIHQVAVGQQVEITLPALPEQTFYGQVKVVNVSADLSSRSYMARIAVDNPEHLLQLGMVAKAQIITRTERDILTLPVTSIVRDPQGAALVYIYYPEQQRVHTKRISTGALYRDQIEITSGLNGDEAIVIAGQEKLREGIEVVLALPLHSQTSKPEVLPQ